MATTPIYSFVTPDLASTADGPAAMSALALRVEREMSVWRATNNYSVESNISVTPGSSNVVVHSVSTASAAIGWAEIEAELFIYGTGAGTTPIAGFVGLKCNAATLRTLRFHTQGKVGGLTKVFSGAVALPAAVTTLAVEITVSVDGPSGGCAVEESNISVRQYGAPVSG